MDKRQINPIYATPETSRVVISNYTCMAVTLLVLAVRFGVVHIQWRRQSGLDDLFLYVSVLAAVVESVLTEHAVRRGLGTYIRPGNAAKLKKLSEFVYASDLFFLIAIFFAKLALVRLVYRFASRSSISKGKFLVLQILIGVWGVFALPAIAFQCGNTLPWLYLPDRCVGQGALWYPTILFSVLLDAWLAVCVWAVVPDMQISAKQRQKVLGLFGFRLITCILGVVQLALLAPALKSINQPRVMPNPTVLKSFVMNASIISAAIPVLYKTLALYTPTTEATVYGPEGRETVTPLEEIKTPSAVALPNPKQFDAFVKESEVSGTPTPKSKNDDTDDFAAMFSSAFNKEIGTTNKF